MLFRFFQTNAGADDDIATGTYPDGAVDVTLNDPSARPRERGRTLRRAAKDRDYCMARSAGQTGAGMVP